MLSGISIAGMLMVICIIPSRPEDANQLWREEGTGLDMLRHQGDTFLKAWALDDASNLLAQSNNNLQLTQQSLKPGLYAIHYFDNGDRQRTDAYPRDTG